MADAMKLLPCPFCGEDAHVRSGVNAYGSCRTDDCWVAERKITVPLDDARQVAQWNLRASPPAREKAPAEGAGEFVKSVVLQDKLDRLSDEYGDLLTEVEALRNRTSEPEAEPAREAFGLSVGSEEWPDTHPAPATADKLRVGDLVRRIRLQVECSSGNLITSGADSEMVRICLSHFNDLADEVAALNEGGE